MAEPEEVVYEVNIDTETDEKLIAQKIDTEIQQSRTYWQDFKDLCTELYFDFLAYKESIRDKTKSNTFIPLSYVDIRITKGRIKQIITGTKPYARCKPKPYNPDLSFKASHFAYNLLDEAEFESFLDLLIQDALIYTGAPFQVTWGTEYKEMPAFWDAESLGEELGIDLTGLNIRIPKFNDENGERVFELQQVRDGIFLEVIPIQDFYLIKNSKNVETDPWVAKGYWATIEQLESAVKSDGSPRYHNLDRLRELGKTGQVDTTEKTRQGQPLKRDYPSPSSFTKDFYIIEFCTDRKIFHWSKGADFLIADDPNPYKKKPYHIARVEKLTGEPFGLSPNRINHLMTRTMNDVVDIIMDGLFLEDNKAWILNEELVDDFEVGAIQGNLIHVRGLDPGMDVNNAIRAIETRAIAGEIMPLWEKLDRVHQLVAGRPDITAGMPVLGAETAYENAQLAAGASTPVIDMTSNLVDTALRLIYQDLFHLAKTEFSIEKSIEILDDNGNLIKQLVMKPSEVYADYDFEFEFLNKERSKIEERAALTNMLMVWGNMKNVDEVSSLIMKNLLLQSGISDTAAISDALDRAIQERRRMEQLALQMKAGGQGGPMGALPEGAQGAIGEPMRDTGNMSDVFKPTGM